MTKILLIALMFSLPVFSKTVKETISTIEIEKNAKCDYLNSGNSFCFNNYCRQRVFFTCTSNENDFKVRLNVRYFSYQGRISGELVKTITYYQ